MPHIIDELHLVGDHLIHLRQAPSADQLPFITFVEETEYSLVNINTKGASIGDYVLKLESYDAQYDVQTTLFTDTVQISILPPPTLMAVYISALEHASWVLDLDSELFSQVQIQLPADLERFVTFDASLDN